MSARICIVMAGHLSTTPRMVKAADALVEAGYRVRVVSTRYVDWAARTDVALRARRPGWDWTEVRLDGMVARQRIRIRRHAARRLCRVLGPRLVPSGLAERAFAPFQQELVSAARAERADLYYGGSSGGVVAAASAAGDGAFAVDLEDLHHEESDDALDGALARRITGTLLPRARFVTAASTAIASAYQDEFGIRAIPIHNTFPMTAPPGIEPRRGSGLLLYWFSQTIGAGRGLEDVVRAMGLAGLRGELHLRGRSAAGYLEALERLRAEVAPRLLLRPHPPSPPDEMVAACRGYDVGLSLERAPPRNRALCLTNKALTFPLAGLPTVLTATPGQRPLADDLGEGALLCEPGDVAGLADGLRRWAGEPARLERARTAAWEAARRRWHWEHPLERGALLAAVEAALG
jgi:glycosyltransferase involved in cell wall biosynthesis